MEKKNGKEFGLLLLGLGMLFGGLVLFFLRIEVSSRPLLWGLFGSGARLSGLIFIPFILGLVLMVMFSKSIWPRILTGLGVLFIVLSVISTMDFYYRGSMFETIMYIIMIFLGGALCLKILIIDDPNRGKGGGL
ncbi:MAG: hypothetical protein K1W00_06620 [Lachnospiraceae bacterium]